MITRKYKNLNIKCKKIQVAFLIQLNQLISKKKNFLENYFQIGKSLSVLQRFLGKNKTIA
jgi:hypothetical protein